MNKDKKVFLISMFSSMLIFLIALVLSLFVYNKLGKFYALLFFIFLLILGIILIFYLILKYIK